MWRNYLQLTLRNLWRQKMFACISMGGLALGISCTTLITMYIQHELSYDDFHVHKDRLMKVGATIHNADVLSSGMTSFGVGPALQGDYADIEAFCRLFPAGANVTLFKEDQSFEETQVYFTDSAFFDMFSFKLLEGDPKTALKAPQSMVISQSMAQKIFGSEPAMGQLLRTINQTYTITGIVEDCPSNSDIQYRALISMSSFPQQAAQGLIQDWFYINTQTFLLFKKPITSAEFQPALQSFADKYVKPWSEANGGVGTVVYDLRAIEDLHLDNTRPYDTPKGNPQYLYIFGVVGVFIILIACINYVNLNLSQSFRRAKEVGVRKTLGAEQSQLIRQFVGESFLIGFFSLIAGLVLVEILLPIFNYLAKKDFGPERIFSADIIWFYAVVLLCIGVLAGSYPAFVLSQFKPVLVLKGLLPAVGKSGFLRKFLVIVQFVFSVWMILGTIVVFNQMQFMKTRDLGFDKESVVMIQIPGDTAVINRMDYAREAISKVSGVSDISISGGYPGRENGELLFRIEQKDGLLEKGIKFIPIDEHFINLMGLQLVQGRNFDPTHFPSDSLGGFIINETAARQWGWDNDAVGKRMQWGLLANDSATNDGKVIGVVKDFHFASLHNPIEPLVLFYHTWGGGFLMTRIQTDNWSQSIEQVEQAWKKVDPVHPFKHYFLDEQLEKKYQNEERMLRIFGYFAFISIFIASMGLFALTAFSTQRRTREIGIRKVMGASVFQIAMLLSREFVMLVAIAFLLALPIGYYYIHEWLQNFAFRIDIHWYYLAITALVVFLIAGISVLWNAVKAARSNPVHALKYE